LQTDATGIQVTELVSTEFFCAVTDELHKIKK
jgi:hypothetical protein